jgi:two-component system NarL family sensor kinase
VPSLSQIVGYLTGEPVRVSALLRLPMIGLIVLLADIAGVKHWLPAVYDAVLVSYAAFAVVWLVIVLRRPVRPWAGWLSTTVDVVAVVTLCVVSGAVTSWLLPVFFLLPISLAFQDRPALTAILGATTAGCYLAAWIVYSKRDDTMGLPNTVYVDLAFLVWLAVATTVLCFVLARRSARVKSLLDMRRMLVSEAMRVDERQTRELAEQLHDGPLQDLLAARLQLEDVLERHADPALDAMHAALYDAATRLRTTVTALHPNVLEAVGLTAALGELVRQYESRANIAIEADLGEVGRPAAQALLYRAARELLANVHKHAQATAVHLGLFSLGDRIVLTVVDDGSGFDKAAINGAVPKGHIGLASLLVRVEAMGGSMDIDTAVGRGTRITVSTPADAV